MEKQPLPVIGREFGTRVCGHKDEFKLLKGEPAAHTKRRKEKWSAKRCHNCVEAANEQSRKEAASLRKIKEAKYRLPHGSSFQASYSAATETWTAMLAVPGEPIDQASGEAIHGLFRHLGFRWRQRNVSALAASMGISEEEVVEKI